MAKGIKDRNTYKKIRYNPKESEGGYILNLEQIQRGEFQRPFVDETSEGFKKYCRSDDPFYIPNERLETAIYKRKKSQKEINDELKEDGVL